MGISVFDLDYTGVILEIAELMSGFRCRFCKGSLMKVHYPKLYNMAHLFTFNAFTDFKGSNNYILSEITREIHEMETSTYKTKFVQQSRRGGGGGGGVELLEPRTQTETQNILGMS